jgi:hypothetical protein
MDKLHISVTYTDPCYIKHAKKGYWQCGVWVHSVTDATVYISHEEADKVILLRGLYNTSVVPVFQLNKA